MLESYTKITNLTDKDPEERVAVLITDIGIDTLKIYTALPFANEREKNNLKRMLNLCEKHFVGKHVLVAFKPFQIPVSRFLYCFHQNQLHETGFFCEEKVAKRLLWQ